MFDVPIILESFISKDKINSDHLVTKMSSLGATGHQSRQELLTWINSLELDYSVSQRG